MTAPSLGRPVLGIIILFFWLALSQTGAIELPVFAFIASSNQGSVYPGRTDREYEYTEQYRFGIGTDSLQVAGLSLDFEIRAFNKLDQYIPYIHTFELGWQRDRHKISVGTQSIGIGGSYSFADRDVMHPAFGGWLFESRRFNSVSFIYGSPNKNTSFALGGNQASRLMSKAAIHVQTLCHNLDAGVIANISDPHWHSPSLTTNLHYKYSYKELALKADLMAKKVLPYKDRPQPWEYAAAWEADIPILQTAQLCVASLYEDRAFAPKQRWELHSWFNKELGSLTVSPGYSIYAINSDTIQSLNASLSWKFYQQCRLELIYKHNLDTFAGSHHDLALQTLLYFNL